MIENFQLSSTKKSDTPNTPTVLRAIDKQKRIRYQAQAVAKTLAHANPHHENWETLVR